jgi:CBS domain containing-hemolysin-like protein
MRVLDLDEPLADNVHRALSAGPTWLPIVRGSLDRVEGVASVKDLYAAHARGELKGLSQVQRPVFFVPEAATLQQLLTEFRRRNKPIAIVVDEHGGTSGLVNLSDVVAELVGNVAEWGRRAEPVRRLPGGRIELPGTAQLDDLEHTLDVEFDVDKSEVSTVAGYLMAKLGRIPKAGDQVSLGDLRVVVMAVDGPRVLSVRVEPLAPAGAPAAALAERAREAP